MAMRVETVDILVEKAHFEPQVAVALAQAMDVAMEEKMQDRQWVTVTVLIEAKSELVMQIERLASELRAEMTTMASELRAEMTTTASELRAEMAAMAGQLRTEMASTAAQLRAEMASMAGQLRAEMHAMKSDLLLHMYTAMGAQLALLIGVCYFFVTHVK